jgi:hypothetical protein
MIAKYPRQIATKPVDGRRSHGTASAPPLASPAAERASGPVGAPRSDVKLNL